ncbi:EAL domain-containing protein [Demequina salsinemoris]|uniref:EAL domain-containing protein n=1 Tax=Demequina salsinemoris TaxID=577470 RepID=UPI0007826E6A|nr:EAL domain-containing protein [Demequina salsinemoris]
MTTEPTIEPLVELCLIVPADTPCDEVAAHIFSRGSRHNLLVEREDGQIGVIGRERFLRSMAGSYGYNRSLLGGTGVGELAVWGLPLLSRLTPLATAASHMMGTDRADDFPDLPVVDALGKPYGVIRPVRVMRALADHAGRRAEIDGMTGLATRERLMAVLEDALAMLEGEDSRVLVAYLDLDRLKVVNDTLGHNLGDALLRSASRRMLIAAAGADVVGRLGGDEFAVVSRIRLPSTVTAEDAALAFGERLRVALAQPDPDLPDAAQAHASIGVAVADSPDADPEELLQLADAAMYSAKLSGGDKVQYGRRTPQGVDQILTEALHLMYQPIIDTVTGVPTAVEALLRVHGGVDDERFPADIKLRAARLGATLELDRWVLGRACKALRHWEADGFKPAADISMHVNLSAESLVIPGLADALLSTITSAGVAPRRIVLELSELSRLGDLTAARTELAALDAAGVRLALDDVGVSLETLRFLQQPLPFSVIKVDRTIVHGAGRGSSVDAEVLAVISRIAEELDVAVIAEGIETEHEYAAVREAGIGLQQGFLHYRPMSEPLLRARVAAATTPPLRTRVY